MINILYEITRFSSFLIIGFTLIRWYGKKKGWSYNVKIDLLLILSWNLIMSLLLLVMDLMVDNFLRSLVYFYGGIYLLFLILMLFISFFLNLYIGFLLFKILYKQNKQDAFIIILIIVIMELIIDNLVLYPSLVSFALNK
jgi:hypothetical protein